MHPKFTLSPIARSIISMALLTSVAAHATRYDYDGDGVADVAVRRASTSYWYVQNSGDDNFNSDRQDGIQRIEFGLQETDIPVPADYDGDGITDIAFRRPSNFTWYVSNSSGDNTNSSREDGIQRQIFGRSADDIPVPADYDGDGTADFAVRRPSTYTWYIRNSDGSNFNSDAQDGIQRIVFGLNVDDTPVTGDFDNDGKADIAVWRSSNNTWYIKNSSDTNYNSEREDGIQRVTFGSDSDIPVPADYDGDGITDIAVRTPSTYTWSILRSSDGETETRVFGRDEDDIPVPADYDGDGKADIAVRRGSNQIFYISNSTDEEIQRINFGTQEDDIPINAPIPEIIEFLDDVDDDEESDEEPGEDGNSPPEADAGDDQEAEIGDVVQLDGSESSDDDGDNLSYAWNFTSIPTGSNATLMDANTVMPTFTADVAGNFVLSLVVNDGTVNSDADSVTITVADTGGAENSAPEADAGDDQEVQLGDTVQLSGADSSDDDGDTLSYSWSITSSPSGSSATLNNGNTVSPNFVADVVGTFTLSLVVNDGTTDSEADNVTITVIDTGGTENTAPEADAGDNQDVETGDTVQLDGSGSSDEDGDSLSYSWSFAARPSGSSASLSNSNTITPSFVADVAGTFRVSLVVNDGTVDSDSDNVRIAVTDPEPENTTPTADAGDDQNVIQGDTVQLSGVDSSDEDDDTLSYSWEFNSRPSGSSASLSNSASVAPTFVADQVGTYSLSLTVSDGEATSSADSVTITATEATDDGNDSAWIINTDETRSNYIVSSGGSQGALVNIESVTTETVNNSEYTKVTASGIPDYQVLATEDLVDSLNDRPNARRDFDSGRTTISAGDTVEFGQDIGYNSNSSCETNAGYGYWPPGPVCPEDLDREGYFPNEPQTTEEDCDTGLGAVGYIVNGTSVYNWGDGATYNSDGVWENLAPIAEQYDVDICGGHAANGDYHHHFYSSCLADLVGDEGNGHSPIYGYAADGYPIYGPWEADGQLAISSWVVRDYSANSDTGCGTDNERSCIMVDMYDPNLGTETTSSNGPDINEEVETQSGNTLEAYAGFYKQDYYWDSNLTEQGGAYLDQYNAHYDEERGYHYHITVTDEDGTLSPYFPFMIGDRYAGELQDNAIGNCSGSGGGGPGGPGNGPGGPR